MTDPLQIAEAVDHYRALCAKSPSNRAARAGQLYELDTISPAATLFLQKTASKLPLLADAEIVILNSSADGGLPHTRPPNFICLPANGIPETAIPSPEFLETLLHEGVHIHQRLHPDLWSQSMRRAGWRPVKTEAIPPEFTSRVRLNPDTIGPQQYWAWDTYHVPLPLFPKGISLPSLSSAEIQWLDLRSATLFHDPPATFRSTYSETGTATEHPYELYAYRFSRQGLKSAEEIRQALANL